MIKVVTGDIPLTKAKATAHGVAPKDDFKTGWHYLSKRDGMRYIRISDIFVFGHGPV